MMASLSSHASQSHTAIIHAGIRVTNLIDHGWRLRQLGMRPNESMPGLSVLTGTHAREELMNRAKSGISRWCTMTPASDCG